MHCRDWQFRNTLETRDAERAERRERLDARMVERMAQRVKAEMLFVLAAFW